MTEFQHWWVKGLANPPLPLKTTIKMVKMLTGKQQLFQSFGIDQRHITNGGVFI